MLGHHYAAACVDFREPPKEMVGVRAFDAHLGHRKGKERWGLSPPEQESFSSAFVSDHWQL